MYTSCLYARGITPAFNADHTYDNQRFTSMVYDGHGTGYICGFGAVFMNGSFVRPPSIQVVEGGGWMGDFTNEGVNLSGICRQLVTNLRFMSRAYRGLNWLVISDKDSPTDITGTGWGQLLNFLDSQGFNTLRHTPAEIQAGAYGYDTRPEYFMQFAGVLLLMSGTSPMNNELSKALTDSITLGASVAVLQKNAIEGAVPVRTILFPLGIEHRAQAYLYADKAAVSDSIAACANHVSWTNVQQLHHQFTRVLSATFVASATGKGTVNNVAGQPGTWEAFNCVDVYDETDIRDPLFYREDCCVEGGSAYEAKFVASVFPQMPENWEWAFERKYLKVDWSSDNALPLADRALIRFRVAGQGMGSSAFWARDKVQVNLTDGYTVIQLDSKLNVIDRQSFNTAQGGTGSVQGMAAATAMAQYIQDIPSGMHVVVVSSVNAWTNHMAGGLPAAMYSLGASAQTYGASWFRSGAAYLLFGTKGINEGTATIEMYCKPTPIEGEAQPILFNTGFNLTDEDIPYCCGTEEIGRNTIVIGDMITNGYNANLTYFKHLSTVDGSKKYGIRHVTKMYDTRFKKLPVQDTKNTVVSVENPCIPPYRYGEWDWIRVWHADENFPIEASVQFKDGHEYIIMALTPDGRLFQDSFLMNQQMYENQSRRIFLRNSNVDGSPTPNRVYREWGASSIVSVYERPAPIVSTVPERNSNQWQIFGAWDPSRYSMQLEAGYEYVVMGADWFGSPEFVQSRILFLPPELQQRWAGPKVLAGVDTSLCRVDASGLLVASITRGENRMPLVVRRPFVQSLDKEDQFGWEIVYHDQDSSAPQKANVPVTRDPDFEYLVLCAQHTSLGGLSCSNFFTWDKISDIRKAGAWTSDMLTTPLGHVGWSYDGKKLLTAQGVSGWGWQYAPYGVYMVLRRRMRAWEPNEVIAGA